MKTAGKIVVGVLVVGGLVGGAIALSHVFPGTSTDCGRLTLDAAAVQRYAAAMMRSGPGLSPRSSAVSVLGGWLRAAFPSCEFDRNTTATLVGTVAEIEWQDVVAILGDKTLGEAESDPAVLAALASLTPQREGSAGIVPDDSVGGSIKDITRMWMGEPLG